jgi:hypothetical protein
MMPHFSPAENQEGVAVREQTVEEHAIPGRFYLAIVLLASVSA